ncbi:MAG: sigma-70 family RNA polymerase sigma factor [Planctomycetes bacterium]|nr:sigma-70 family RNA polymerase sigma factor [Planctomycetota bacterium]
MRDRTVERLFERFRSHGDVRALGDVFDATAEELLRIATSLTRQLPEAEDLLQATFVTAIERAKHWDREQRLVPWLCGILVRHAHARRRERLRDVDAERLERTPERAPIAAASAAEFERELERALGELASDDRAVLVAYLREGKEPIEIARERGLAPGTARMRVHRGLERLRKALPAGFALGAGALLAGRGLAAVRDDVVREATAAAAKLVAGGSISSAPTLGGLLVVKKALVALIVVALLSFVAWWRSTAESTPLVGAGTTAVASASADEVPRASLEAPRAELAPREAARAPDAAVDVAYRSALAGLRGRVVDAERSPRAGVEVVLFETRAVDWFRDEFDLQEPRAPQLELGRTVTDAEGRFTFDGARPEALHALGIALGRGNGAVHFVREPLDSASTRDLGDFVLAAGAPVRGRVVDDEGRPLAGVRVRAGEIAPLFLELGPADLRAQALVLLRSERETKVFELPHWAEPYLERLPLATTRTDERGEFVLDDVPSGRVTLLADAPQRVSAVVESLAVEEGVTRDAGDLVLARGGRVEISVVDASGAHVGADVRVGVVRASALGAIGCLERARERGEGIYEAEGLDADGAVWVAVRRTEHDAWTASELGRRDGLATVTLPALAEREFVVEDSAGVVAGATLALVPTVAAFDAAQRWLATPRPRVVTTDANGRAQFVDVADGAYTLVVTGPSGARTRLELELAAESGPRKVRLPGGRAVEFRVTDATSGEPVASAELALTSADRRRTVPSRATTDADGRARIVGVERDDPAIAWSVRIDHPRYGRTYAAVDFDCEVQECRLEATGAVAARLASQARDLPDAALVLEPRPEPRPNYSLANDFRIARFDGDGLARCAGLAPGRYRYELVEGLPSEVGAQFLASIELPMRTVGVGEFVVESGRTTELEVAPREATRPEPRRAGVTLTGTLKVDGRTAANHVVEVQARGCEPRQDITDGGGRFRIEGLGGGTVAVCVSRSARLGAVEYVGVRMLELPNDGEVELPLELETLSVTVTVLDDVTSEPVPDARVVCQGRGTAGFGERATDRKGRAKFQIGATDGVVVRCVKPGVGVASGTFELDAQTTTHAVQLRLRFAPRFGFRVAFAEGVEAPANLRLDIVDGAGVAVEVLVVDPKQFPDADYGFDSLVPGRYELRASGPEVEFEPVPFDVTDVGASSFVFRLQPKLTPAAPGARR